MSAKAKLRRRDVVLAAGAALAGGMRTSARAAPADSAAPLPSKIKLIIGIANSLVYSSTILAAEFGYFERENIVASLETIDGGQTAQSLVAMGRMDASVAGLSAGMLNGISDGLLTKMVALSGSVPAAGDAPSGLFVRKELFDSGKVNTIAQLKGRRLAGTAVGSTASFFLALYLKQAGLTLRDVDYVELATAPTAVAMTNGAVDAAFLTAPFSSQLFGEGIATPLGNPNATLAPNCATGTVFGPNLLLKNRQAGTALLRAMTKVSRDFLRGDYRSRPDVVKTLAKFTGVDETIIRANPVYDFAERLSPDPAILGKMEAAFRPLDLLQYKNGLAADAVFDLVLPDLAYRSSL
jgi:NitT/TauT family transport system substrate-binding protein